MSIAIAMLLDAILGDPRSIYARIPHPTVIIGRAIGWLDMNLNTGLNTGTNRRLRGIATVALLVTASLLFARLIAALPASQILQTVLAAMLLAQRSLTIHVGDVARALHRSLAEGRAAVAHIVSRDTSALNEAAIARSAIESAAENLSDGVIAPVFWFLIAGFPGLLIYKVINTADSMIGYKNPQYADFGWAAARLDDVVNWLPARLTATLIALAHFRPDATPIILRDAPLHRSPNAGWPEAAMAACLNVSLAGPRSYDGEIRDFPLVHPEGETNLDPNHIKAAVTALWRTWALALIIVIALALA